VTVTLAISASDATLTPSKAGFARRSGGLTPAERA